MLCGVFLSLAFSGCVWLCLAASGVSGCVLSLALSLSGFLRRFLDFHFGGTQGSGAAVVAQSPMPVCGWLEYEPIISSHSLGGRKNSHASGSGSGARLCNLFDVVAWIILDA